MHCTPNWTQARPDADPGLLTTRRLGRPTTFARRAALSVAAVRGGGKRFACCADSWHSGGP